jgi:hypothetical protein
MTMSSTLCAGFATRPPSGGGIAETNTLAMLCVILHSEAWIMNGAKQPRGVSG